jgi:hypothetical protein
MAVVDGTSHVSLPIHFKDFLGLSGSNWVQKGREHVSILYSNVAKYLDMPQLIQAKLLCVLDTAKSQGSRTIVTWSHEQQFAMLFVFVGLWEVPD